MVEEKNILFFAYPPHNPGQEASHPWGGECKKRDWHDLQWMWIEEADVPIRVFVCFVGGNSDCFRYLHGLEDPFLSEDSQTGKAPPGRLSLTMGGQ